VAVRRGAGIFVYDCAPIINNNTVVENVCTDGASGIGAGIYSNSGGSTSGVNNIVYFNQSTYMPQCAGNVDFSYSCCSEALSGIGNITANPLFVNLVGDDYNLQQNSPCIDTGDPNSPLDPDNTRADMGALYFDQGAVSPLAITLTPYNPPITIPASGGSFDFNVALDNADPSSQTFDAWIMAMLPNGSQFGPVLGPINLTLPSGVSINRDRTQAIPAGAPAGTYAYTGYVGDYPDDVWDSDSFPFEKLETGIGPMVPQWENTGDSFALWQTVTEVGIPTALSLSAHPNPFNPSTTISFQLPVAGFVKLEIFDVNGCDVGAVREPPRWYPPGIHEITFDGSHLPSGVYFARLTAGDFKQTQKLMLIK